MRVGSSGAGFGRFTVTTLELLLERADEGDDAGAARVERLGAAGRFEGPREVVLRRRRCASS